MKHYNRLVEQNIAEYKEAHAIVAKQFAVNPEVICAIVCVIALIIMITGG